MKIFLDALGNSRPKPWYDPLLQFQELAQKDEVGKHIVTLDQESADIILTFFYDPPIYCKLPVDKRRFGFSTYDLGFPFYPGLYPSLPQWNAHPSYARSAPYPLRFQDEGDIQLNCKNRKYLFSFVGSVVTSPVRNRVIALKHQQALLLDTSQSDGYKGGQSSQVYAEFRSSFQRKLADSDFILCPRGIGVSSIRLFETRRSGRVPVVISDHWVPPSGIPWEQFIVQIDENDIESIPDRLETLKKHAYEMGHEARIHWEKNFSSTQIFNWIINQISEMYESVEDRFYWWKTKKMMDMRNMRFVTLPMIKYKFTKFRHR